MDIDFIFSDSLFTAIFFNRKRIAPFTGATDENIVWGFFEVYDLNDFHYNICFVGIVNEQAYILLDMHLIH